MNPKSHTLFHFTRARETLKLILKNGFWPRYCLEDVGWLGFESFAYIAYPMVCFCDIPLSRISEHVNFYGEFGIGLTKQWAEANALNPVLYVAGENNVTASFRELNIQACKLSGADQEASHKTVRYLYAYAKPTIGTIVVDGQPVRKEFYQESEWRYIPKNDDIKEYLHRSAFDAPDEIKTANELTQKYCCIRFELKDIKYVSSKQIPTFRTSSISCKLTWINIPVQTSKC